MSNIPPELDQAHASPNASTEAYPNAIVFDDQEVGYIDRDGNIRLIDGDRIVGHIANDQDYAISVLRDRYLQYVEQTRLWCEETRQAENRLWRIADCDRRMREIGEQYVLGSFDEIRAMLTELKADLLQEQQERIAIRTAMIAEAKALAERTDWKEASAAFDELDTAFKAVGSTGDRDGEQKQWDAFKELERAFRSRRKAHFDEMERQFAERATAKQLICEQAESLQDSDEFRSVTLRMRDLMEEWKAVGFAGREHDDALWRRFQAARDTFGERRKVWFEENAVRKQEMAEKAEELMHLDDAAAAQNQMKPLMQQWRETGSAGKAVDEELWTRFRGAQESIYQRSRVIFDARQQERERNYEARESLVREAQSLLGQDSRQATARCKQLQQEWKTIGQVPRELNEPQWLRFRAACDAVFRAAQAEGKRRLVDARDRAEEQIRKLSGEIDEHERKIAHWEGVIANLRDGSGAEEIRASMNEKIATARERIDQKLVWIEEHHRRMTDLANKM